MPALPGEPLCGQHAKRPGLSGYPEAPFQVLVFTKNTTPQDTREPKRLDHALTFDGTHCCDQISFMWSGLYECEAGLGKPLKEQIRDDWRRLIVVDAFGWESNKRKGVVIRGYGIAEGQMRLTYYDSNWQIKSSTIPISNGWINPDFGQRYNTEHQENRYHIRLQEVWIPFDWTDMAPDFWLHIEGINAFGDVSNHTFSVRY